MTETTRAENPSGGVNSSEVSIPVAFRGGTGSLTGTLTVPAGGARTAQLLVHGYSYARYYWDFPYQSNTYSYVRHATQAGYATLAIDRLGDGASTKPPGRHLTWNTSALAAATAVNALRDGRLGVAFEKVVLVGHSYGSVTGYLVAARHPGLSALIATGAAHRVNLAQIAKLVLNSPPAVGNPALHTTDPLYVTTRRGWRSFFYNKQNTDPEVIAVDERLKQTAGLFELPTALPYLVNRVSRNTNVPVLTVLGDSDQIFTGVGGNDCSCDAALAASERRFYGPHAQVEATVIRGGGHNINLERTAPQAYQRITEFLDRHVGP